MHACILLALLAIIAAVLIYGARRQPCGQQETCGQVQPCGLPTPAPTPGYPLGRFFRPPDPNRLDYLGGNIKPVEWLAWTRAPNRGDIQTTFMS